MATQRAAIKAKLTSAAAWIALATPAPTVQWWDEWGRNGLEQSTALYNATGQLLLQGVLRYGTNIKGEIESVSSKRFVYLYLYHYKSYETLLAAQNTARSILHRATISYDTGRVGFMSWVEDSGEFIADELKGAVGVYSRYVFGHSQR